MKSIFPSSIDGDLLRLVHLSNGFKMVPGAEPLKVGDACKSEAKVVSVTNSREGKTVKVKGFLYTDGKAVMEFHSAFLYRGQFTDFETTFDTVQEPDYLVNLATDASVGVLQSKEWFAWLDETKPLVAGTSLLFRIESEILFKDRASFREVRVSGDIFTRDRLNNLTKVGYVDFQEDDCKGNPVAAYLQRHGVQQDLPTPLANNGYSLTTADVSSTFTTPLTNEPYSKVSGDFNPIHVNPYFSCYASLPTTITHGMWTSAATRRYVENVVAKDHPERVLS